MPTGTLVYLYHIIQVNHSAQVATAKGSNECIHHSRPCSGRAEIGIKLIALHNKMHTMATHHGGAGCPIQRDINLHIKDAETTGLDNDNESISGLDTNVALGGPEAKGHPDELIHSN